MPESEPWVSQTGQRRVAVLGRLPDREPCTLLFVQDEVGDGWQCYRLGLTKDAIALTGEDRDRLAAKLRDRYERGATLRDLATEVGRSYGLVRKLVLAQGVTLRARGGAGRRTVR